MKKRGEQIKGRRKKHDRGRKRKYKHLSSLSGWSFLWPMAIIYHFILLFSLFLSPTYLFFFLLSFLHVCLSRGILSEWNMWVRIVRMKRGRGDIYIYIYIDGFCFVWGRYAMAGCTHIVLFFFSLSLSLFFCSMVLVLRK